ncbi:MAG: MFS transporter [Gemmatimonadota bacterium]
MAHSRAHSSHPAVLAVFTTVFIDIIGFGIVLPLLPSYAARLAVSDTRIGVLVASFSLCQFLLAPWWGRLSDRIGRRPVILIGLAGSALSYLLFAYAGSFEALLLSRVLAGCMGATVNVAQAYLADVTTPEKRSSAMGLIGAAFGLGFVVGPLIGGISSHYGDHLPGLVAAGLCTINLVLAMLRLPESSAQRSRERIRAPVDWPLLLPPALVVLLSSIAFTVMYVVFPLYLERAMHYDRRHTAYFFVLLGLVTAGVQGGLVGRVVRRFGERRVMEAGCVIVAVGLMALPLVTGAAVPAGIRLPGLIVVMLLLGFGPGLITPSTSGYVSRMTSANGQGRALGLLASAGAVARVVGPVLAGVLSGVLGSPLTFMAMALVALAGAIGGVAARGTRKVA